MPLLRLAMPLLFPAAQCRRRSAPCCASAFLRPAMAGPCSAIPLLSLSAPCCASATLSYAVPLLCLAKQIYAFAFPSCPMPSLRCSSPPPGRSFHSHALAVPWPCHASLSFAIAMPSKAFPLRIRAVPCCPCRALAPWIFASPSFASANPGTSMPCLRRASPNRAQPWLRGSPLLHRLGQLRFAFPPLNRSVRCLRLPMPLYAFASHSCAMVCLCIESHVLAMPSHIIASPVLATASRLDAMLLLCCAVRSWPRTDVPCRRSVVLVHASASHGFYLPCHRSVSLIPALPSLGAARPHRSMPRLSCVPGSLFSGAPRDPLFRSLRSAPRQTCLCRSYASTRGR